jgi:RNA polymerase sigma-70 factor (ECF subfamily)
MFVPTGAASNGAADGSLHLRLADLAVASFMSVVADTASEGDDVRDRTAARHGSSPGERGGRPSIASLRRGEPTAWRWFVDEYGQGIVNYARRMGHRDPEEVMGATLETVARGIARFEGNHSQLRSFVYSIAHARIVDDVRKRSRRQDMGTGILEDLHVPEATDPDGDGRLLAALEHLSESQRMMIHLRYVEGLSTKETARAVGKSEVATRVALSRGLSQLRDVLNGEIS